MNAKEQEVFANVVEILQETYPKREIKIVREFDRELVYADGECKLCTTGYNLLYNLKRITKCLEDELI